MYPRSELAPVEIVPSCGECGQPIPDAKLEDFDIRFFISAIMPREKRWDHKRREYVMPEGDPEERRVICQFFHELAQAERYVAGELSGVPFFDKHGPKKPVGREHQIHYDTVRRRHVPKK